MLCHLPIITMVNKKQLMYTPWLFADDSCCDFYFRRSLLTRLNDTEIGLGRAANVRVCFWVTSDRVRGLWRRQRLTLYYNFKLDTFSRRFGRECITLVPENSKKCYERKIKKRTVCETRTAVKARRIWGLSNSIFKRWKIITITLIVKKK